MKKAPIAVALVLVFGLFAVAFSLAPAIAQYTPPSDSTSTSSAGNSTGNSTTTSNATSTNATSTNATGTTSTNATGGGTFSARGSIATLIFDTGEVTTTSEMQNETGTTTGNETSTTGNMTTGNTTTSLSQTITGGSNNTGSSNATGSTSNMTGTSNATSTAANETSTTQELDQPFVLAGDWSLDVQDGSVNNFAANFTMVHIDGTMRHTHEFSNFKSDNSTTIDTSGNGTSFIMGTVDIATDGQPKWTGVDALIIIQDNNVISISVATEDTDDHFKGQPIYGIVDSMTDENGNELIQTGGTQTAGNATSGNATGGNQTGGNQTGGFLGNVTEGLKNLTGG